MERKCGYTHAPRERAATVQQHPFDGKGDIVLLINKQTNKQASESNTATHTVQD